MKLSGLAFCLGLLAFACSAENDGPTPAPTAILPDVICTAQSDSLVSITGSGFSPLVVDGLTEGPSVVMPQIVFVDPAGVETEVPSGGVTLPDRSGTALDAVVR